MATKEEEKYVVQPSAAPTNKVTAGVLGGALATIVVIVIQMTTSTTFPPGFEAAVAVVFSFVAGYLTKDNVQVESVKENTDV